MYEYVKGLLIYAESSHAIIDVGGMGYKIKIGTNTHANLPVYNTTIQLFVSFIVREDMHALYGFLKKEERELFELLNTVSGVGPKTALAVVDGIDYTFFYRSIQEGTFPFKIPGIGKKMSERILLELKDKLKMPSNQYAHSSSTKNRMIADAIQALVKLGYSFHQAQKAVQITAKESPDCSDLSSFITIALRQI